MALATFDFSPPNFHLAALAFRRREKRPQSASAKDINLSSGQLIDCLLRLGLEMQLMR